MTLTLNQVKIVIAGSPDPEAGPAAVRDAGNVAVDVQVERPTPGFATPTRIRTLESENKDLDVFG